jgi:hypothetical protein
MVMLVLQVLLSSCRWSVVFYHGVVVAIPIVAVAVAVL